MLRLVVLVLLLILSAGPACTPLRPGGADRVPDTGIHGAYSAQAIIARDRHTVLVGQVLVLRQQGRTALTAEVGQLPHSGQRRLRMISAWDRGRELRFRRAMRAEPFCVGQRRCQGYRTGTFVFTPGAFDTAAHHGFRATLTGPDGVMTVVYPAALFSEARDRARASGLWPKP